jgi:hypothetical protein
MKIRNNYSQLIRLNSSLFHTLTQIKQCKSLSVIVEVNNLKITQNIL